MMKINFICFVILFFSVLITSAQVYTLNAASNGQTYTTCGGTFYDSGGAGGNYGNNENNTVTFCSSTGVVNLSFSSCILANNDILTIYNGPNTSSPVLYQLDDGNFLPFVAQSTCGCLTISFVTGNSGVAAGWVATLGCSTSNDYAVNAIAPPLDGTCLTGQSNVGSTADYNIGCFASGNTVWYYIDLTGGANTIDVSLQNATFANVEYVLMYDFSCVPFSGSSAGALCVSSSTTASWTNLVDGIYWLGISSTVEGTFDLCITQSYTDYCGDDFCGALESCNTCFVDCGACPEAEGGPYFHPMAGRQNTYVGQCMVTTCSGTYYDNGGPGVNYADNINQVYRTFCPNEAGDAISVSFSELGIAAGDWLAILNGPTQNSPTIWKGYGSIPTPTTTEGIWSNPITSTHSSGCLTFRFYSSATTNAAGWTSALSCVPHPLGLGPSATYNNDCTNARPICDDVTIQSEVWGPGLESEGCGSCVTSENWTEWYWVRVQSSGTMQFEVTPQGGSDMDFAIYKATDCDDLGSPLRCSYASYASPGKTGLTLAAGDLSEDVSGDQWVAELNITAGEIYFIMINEWYKTNPNAYNMDFVLTNGAAFDCSITLPVTFYNFTAAAKEKNIELVWKTASETNNNYFTIERSTDGNIFESIGKVDGAGNSNELIEYIFKDTDPYQGLAYYRIKQTDFDGSSSYSKTISIDVVEASDPLISIYPIPANDQLNFSTTNSSVNKEFVIYNALGIEISFGIVKNTTTTLSISDLDEGLYYLAIDGSIEHPFMVVRQPK